MIYDSNMPAIFVLYLGCITSSVIFQLCPDMYQCNREMKVELYLQSEVSSPTRGTVPFRYFLKLLQLITILDYIKNKEIAEI